MYTHSITSTTPSQADQILLALKYLDDDNRATAASLLMRGAQSIAWFRRALWEAMEKQQDEQNELDAWGDAEAARYDARHADPYGGSKEGDGSYWTQ